MFVSQTWQGTYQEMSTRTQLQVRYPSRVIIDQNTADPVHVLIGALTDSANPVQTVELCNVDFDSRRARTRRRCQPISDRFAGLRSRTTQPRPAYIRERQAG